MSTPRRDCPRSSGTPRILIRLATMLSATTGCLAGSVLLATGAVVVSSGVIVSNLRINPSQCPRKGNRLTHVLQPAYPRHGPLNAHAKACMRHAAVLAQIEIPLERLFRQAMFVYAFQQMLVIANTLRTADDLAVSFRRQHIHGQRQLRTLRVRLHVKGLHLRRVAVHHHRLVKLRRNIRLVGGTKISAPLKLSFDLSLGVTLL